MSIGERVFVEHCSYTDISLLSRPLSWGSWNGRGPPEVGWVEELGWWYTAERRQRCQRSSHSLAVLTAGWFSHARGARYTYKQYGASWQLFWAPPVAFALKCFACVLCICMSLACCTCMTALFNTQPINVFVYLCGCCNKKHECTTHTTHPLTYINIVYT